MRTVKRFCAPSNAHLGAQLDDPVRRDSAGAATMTRIRELSGENEADRLAALVQRLAPDRLSS